MIERGQRASRTHHQLDHATRRFFQFVGAGRGGDEYGQGFSIGRPTPLEKVLGALVGATMDRSAGTKTA